jgi:5-methylcytosine-specific restriction endonuclease McrA
MVINTTMLIMSHGRGTQPKEKTMARPKINPPKNPILTALVERDGRHCYLCGMHHRNDTNLGVDMIVYDENPKNMENLFLACIPCIRRRSKKPFLQYVQERLKFAKAELSYINGMFHPKNVDEASETARYMRYFRPTSVGHREEE